MPGKFQEARVAHEQAVRSNSKNRTINLELLYLYSGDFARAEESAKARLKEIPADRYALWYHPQPALMRGDLDAADQRLNLALHHTYYQIACIYSVLAQTEKGIAWLERSVDTGNPCWPFFQVDPHLQNLRQESRFQELISSLERKYTAVQIRRL